MFGNIFEENFYETGFCKAILKISGKYKLCVLYALAEFKIVRFNELKRYIGKISVKTLTSVLRELERDGLIERKEFPEKVRRVEYSLSERGKTLIPILVALCEWGDFYKK